MLYLSSQVCLCLLLSPPEWANPISGIESLWDISDPSQPLLLTQIWVIPLVLHMGHGTTALQGCGLLCRSLLMSTILSTISP